MSVKKTVHLEITFILQKRSMEIMCSKNVTLRQILLHLSRMPECDGMEVYCKKMIIIENSTGTVLDDSRTLQELRITDGMSLRIYI